ncbi:DUF1365 domain-containing protein [Solimonas sp. SE-A11]|uniref:DUF1365 domain-containing protein n=1 Tax=Solimonas sp. SE-A11 TaxID=3054954 RepID=UPI00259D01CB|nr:DUF1365 domain-containing protein [Solimonas sp. SE-A11]MDM4770571.1 DUF1365 domain-containing protein [Solimonas sp. SE-A11]
MDVDQAGWLYPARVMHRRRIAPLYRFVYRVFYLLVDIDRLPEMQQRLRFFSLDRFNLLSLRTRDYGDGRGLRPWAEDCLRRHGIEPDGGRIRLLTLPRIFGWAFNPISLWYCEYRDGSLRAVIAEVRNTFGERHSYLLASGGAPMPYEQVHDKDKCFHVSPFLDRAGQYRFQLGEPGERLRVAIHESRDGVPVMDATLAAERRELSDAALLRQVLRMPWMAVKVVAGIHWEALKLWLRGAGYRSKPAPLPQDLT